MRKCLFVILVVLIVLPISSSAVHWLNMDFDKDGDVDASDLAEFAFVYGKQCSDESVVWEGDYTIDTREDMENLLGYTEVTGNLTIKNTSLENLDSLVCLTTVGGNFEIETNYDLTGLEGLVSLTSVNGNFYIRDNIFLNLQGLNNLSSVGGTLLIGDHVFMTSIEGFENLTSVGVTLLIANNRDLVSLPALQNLCVGTLFRVQDNPNLCQSDIDDIYTAIDQYCNSIGSDGPLYIYENNKSC
jgi:hypothetical protein